MKSRRNSKKTIKKLYHFDEICESKRFFKTKEAAFEAADIRMLENMAADIDVYQCATCLNWHLTSKK
jgi:hypothetical protein